MKALRIILTQSSANYKKEETVKNKMTYPLPPFSTVIGALHNACGYKTYHPMDISVQGRYESMNIKPYTDYCFLNSVNDDRGILVKMRNPAFLSTAFEKVAVARKKQGNSFRKGTTIDVINESLLNEYRDLKDLSDEIAEFDKERIKPLIKRIKDRKGKLTNKKKQYDKNSPEANLIAKRIGEMNLLKNSAEERYLDFKINKYDLPYSRFANIVTSLSYYEILNNIELVLHIRSDEETLLDIKKNIYNLKSIGRSEDYVNIEEVCLVTLLPTYEDGEIISEYSAYIDYDLIKDETILLRTRKGTEANGTKYYLNKNYVLDNSKRVFEKKKVIYASEYSAEEARDNLFFDITEDRKYIVNFN